MRGGHHLAPRRGLGGETAGMEFGRTAQQPEAEPTKTPSQAATGQGLVDGIVQPTDDRGRRHDAERHRACDRPGRGANDPMAGRNK